jgi:hypothetical protein
MRERDVRIRLAEICPIDGHGDQVATRIDIKDSGLAPRVLDRHELERAPGQRVKRMRDLEGSMRNWGIDRI